MVRGELMAVRVGPTTRCRHARNAAIRHATATTRQLARRLPIRLRAMPERIAVDCLAPDAAERALKQVQENR